MSAIKLIPLIDLPVIVNGVPTTARQLIAKAHDRANGFADRQETTGRLRPDPTAYECGWHEGTIERLCAELHQAQARRARSSTDRANAESRRLAREDAEMGRDLERAAKATGRNS